MASGIAEKVFTLIKDTVESKGVTLWDVKFVKEGASFYLRVIIDKPEGINIDDCTEVHHAIDPILDEADPIDKSYYLEVCSPGLERDLTRQEHFNAFVGEKIKIRLYKALDGIKEFKGVLKEYDGDKIVLTADDSDLEFNQSMVASAKSDDSDF
ncbi:MAG: ribosome maturation factor RimP [Clostridia bacterium]|nr:ribosome maturation factor RimP [Clostridia bacterium]